MKFLFFSFVLLAGCKPTDNAATVNEAFNPSGRVTVSPGEYTVFRCINSKGTPITGFAKINKAKIFEELRVEGETLYHGKIHSFHLKTLNPKLHHGAVVPTDGAQLVATANDGSQQSYPFRGLLPSVGFGPKRQMVFGFVRHEEYNLDEVIMFHGVSCEFMNMGVWGLLHGN